jgi:hypothetical protein
MNASYAVSDSNIVTSVVSSIRLRVAIDRTWDFADAPAAIRYVEEGRVRGKAVVVVARRAPANPSGSPDRVSSQRESPG